MIGLKITFSYFFYFMWNRSKYFPGKNDLPPDDVLRAQGLSKKAIGESFDNVLSHRRNENLDVGISFHGCLHSSFQLFGISPHG